MKNYILYLFVFSIMVSCGNETEKKNKQIAANYEVYGDTIAINTILSPEEIQDKYKNLAVKDTVDVVFKATVKDVCQAKGCWMKLDLENGEETMVKFKDYSFFVPKDITGKQVVLGGKAFVSLMDVDEQKHYAEDAGKTPEEINAITQPLKTNSFEATGVLLPK
ncbi:DUF4920 domain-containing protein [Galbibacter mesophilus]|uniref:DUF4920 domain-containing protein n=1 Tax=Galbibacter mesophilus TaxID=379069 RepID=UPI00191FA7F4|nr:DUF4920 domain-containing protein [Galbibacter mesophilus]MCM5663972.1 DUF4920 domain-containing protein [Galbibacter mesophilus]